MRDRNVSRSSNPRYWIPDREDTSFIGDDTSGFSTDEVGFLFVGCLVVWLRCIDGSTIPTDTSAAIRSTEKINFFLLMSFPFYFLSKIQYALEVAWTSDIISNSRLI